MYCDLNESCIVIEVGGAHIDANEQEGALCIYIYIYIYAHGSCITSLEDRNLIKVRSLGSYCPFCLINK